MRDETTSPLQRLDRSEDRFRIRAAKPMQSVGHRLQAVPVQRLVAARDRHPPSPSHNGHEFLPVRHGPTGSLDLISAQVMQLRGRAQMQLAVATNLPPR
jgi:hypothetical protein